MRYFLLFLCMLYIVTSTVFSKGKQDAVITDKAAITMGVYGDGVPVDEAYTTAKQVISNKVQ